MAKLLTPEQAKRAFRKEARKYEIESSEHLTTVLFDYMDDKLLAGTYFDTLLDLYTVGYLSEESFDEATEAIYLYYGDLITEFVNKE